MKKNIIITIIGLLALTLVACSSPKTTEQTPESSAPAEKKEITIAAASSLTKAFTEVGAAFEKAENCRVTFSFGATGSLSEQLINGAPFDVFAAADESIVAKLDKAGQLISDTIQPYAVGSLGIASLKKSNIEIKSIEDLLKPEIKKIAIANTETAPYGITAKQTLENSKLWDKIEPKLVYGKNISDTLALVTTGNVEAGFISLSLNDTETLNFTLIDSKMHEPIRQAIAVTKRTKEEEMGRKFIEFVKSKEGQEIMSKYGFKAWEE
ncbi:MAG: modA [Clostridiales bacterium]|jgi:molybdate transport system substrate-binding protein|nr:modA [Clostridiales bacterium]